MGDSLVAPGLLLQRGEMRNEYGLAPRAAFDIDEHEDAARERAEPARWPGRRTGVDAARIYRSAAALGTPGKVSRASLEAATARSQGDRIPAGLRQRLER